MEFNTEKYLTATDVALQLQISEKTLANWRCTGAGPCFRKIGASVRYLQSDIDAWVAERKFYSTTASQLAAP